MKIISSIRSSGKRLRRNQLRLLAIALSMCFLLGPKIVSSIWSSGKRLRRNQLRLLAIALSIATTRWDWYLARVAISLSRSGFPAQQKKNSLFVEQAQKPVKPESCNISVETDSIESFHFVWCAVSDRDRDRNTQYLKIICGRSLFNSVR